MKAMFVGRGEVAYEDAVESDFEDLFQAHRRPAYRLALLLCGGDAPLAEDAVSQAFADVLPRWRAGGIEDFGTYLRRCVVNDVRRTQRRRALLRRAQPWLLDAPRGGVEEDVVRQQVLWTALRLLPEKQRTAIVLRYYEGLPVDEVADAMGTTAGTAKAHLSRGRTRLRVLLEESP
jgi:RNA polymerase sigma factor (sigma-70 family)